MWQITETWVGASSEVHVWVSFPVSDDDNRVAALMLHPDVGMAVASPHAAPVENALARIAEAQKIRADHPAVVRLKTLAHASKLKLRSSPASPAAKAPAAKKRRK
jgi:hypothetical protein